MASAPIMTEAQYREYLKRRNAQKGARMPLPALRESKTSKWSSVEKKYFYGVLRGIGEYEGETIRITPEECEKHEYTPDFVTKISYGNRERCEGPITYEDLRVGVSMGKVYHEVKGSYRLGSQDGARLRWCFAAVSRPQDIFVWSKESKTKGKWDIEVWYDGGRTRTKGRGVTGFDFNERGGVVWR